MRNCVGRDQEGEQKCRNKNSVGQNAGAQSPLPTPYCSSFSFLLVAEIAHALAALESKQLRGHHLRAKLHLQLLVNLFLLVLVRCKQRDEFVSAGHVVFHSVLYGFLSKM